MRERPMGDLPAILSASGTQFRYGGKPGHLPFEMNAAGLPFGYLKITAEHSSQPVAAFCDFGPVSLYCTVYNRGVVRVAAGGAG